jgi:hypothetical protein
MAAPGSPAARTLLQHVVGKPAEDGLNGISSFDLVKPSNPRRE